MPPVNSLLSTFPQCTPEYLLSFQFSTWYPKFSHISVRSTIIRPLSQEFREYLDSDGVFIPEGSEDIHAESTLSDDEEDDGEDEGDQAPQYTFPNLDAEIREIIKNYGAVFPKLNFSSPKDAAWILPASSPLKCISPADVYLLLKSSDFVSHDLDRDSVFQGCNPSHSPPPYDLELVLRKWYPMDCSRELRCFVRQDILLGMSQRDTNYYEFLNEAVTRHTIITAVTQFWETHIKSKTGSEDYTFDILLTRDLSRAHVIDLNPYAPRTDPLLFTYEGLLSLLVGDRSLTPQLMVIDSTHHPAANRNAPTHQHNMVPLDALCLSSGRNLEEFDELWQEEISKTWEEER